MNYEGGMMSTWNKFCFTGGRIEASVQLPGANNVMGLWPAVWTMGNLGALTPRPRVGTLCADKIRQAEPATVLRSRAWYAPRCSASTVHPLIGLCFY